MADAAQAPSERLMRLYQAWADGGAGLLISGNVMVDSRAMTGPGGVVLENDAQLEKFRRWARIGRSAGAQFWLQINHPGRQMQANLGQQAWAPSAVPLELGGMSRHFATPKAMDEAMIAEVIQRFARSAGLAERAGFSGVEIHAAHGYLLSQFLSPLSNRRSDAWGGSLENRARLLLEIVRAVRAEVAPGFAVAVKLNSADFQRGGFSADDAREVVRMLDGLGVDLVELSGGSYEAPAMQGEARDGRTLAREAYFVGIGTALAIEPNLPRDWRAGKDSAPQLRPITWKNKPLASLANMAAVKFQLRKLSRGRATNPRVSPLCALLAQQAGALLQTRRYRRLMRSRAEA